jgi:iron complex transport system substrate-binding protein
MTVFSRRAAVALFTATVAVAVAPTRAAAAPRRVISLDGSLTEIIYALERESMLVAVDATAQYPEAARALPNVGYHRQLSAEGVLAMKGDLILMPESAGPPSAVAQIERGGARIVRVPFVESEDGILEKIRIVASALDAPSEGRMLMDSVSAELATLDAAVARAAVTEATKPSLLFLLSLPPGAPPAAGSATGGDALIRMVGGRNVFESERGYKPVSAEALAAAQPDAILIADHQLSPDIGDLSDILRRRSDFAALKAVQTGRVRAVPSGALLGFGPRTPRSLLDLAEWLYASA